MPIKPAALLPMNPGTAMDICLVSRVSCRANGGTSAYIGGLGAALRRRGHTVQGLSVFNIAAPVVTDYGAFDRDSPRLLESEGGEIETRLVSPTGMASKLLPRMATLLTRGVTRRLGIDLYISALRESVAQAIPASVNVVHYTGNGFEMIGFAALAEARRRGIPFTVMPFVHPNAWGDSDLDVELYNRADAIFICSEYEGKHLESRGVRPQKLRRTGLAPATSKVGDPVGFRRKHNLGERPLVLFVGRKERYKGYHALRQAMTDVVKAVPDACLIAVGADVEPPFPLVPDGALLDLGQLPQNLTGEQEKSDAFDACDIFCMPSNAEAFGIVYAEAWSYGKPVVGGPAPAVRELIEAGVTGYCVSQEPREIADVLIRMLKDREGSRRMGANGLALQSARFTWDTVSENHERVFMQLRSASIG